MQSATRAAGTRRLRELFDVLRYVLLIFLTALGVAVALAGAVLLLALPARAAEIAPAALSPMHAAEARQGTLLFRTGEGEELAVPLVSTEVRIHVTGPLAHARVVQTFRNPSEQWFEGIYVFPLPENAAVSALRMHVGERVIEAEMQERSRAAASYRQAREEGRRAALLEQERPNLFTASVANIGPREEIVVELEYRQALDYRMVDGRGRFSLRFPMVVGPRYVPGTGVADAGRIAPPVARPGDAPPNPVSLRVLLDAGAPIEHIESPFHPVHVLEVDEARRQVVLAEGRTPAERDFELAWSLAADREAGAALFFEPGRGGTNYALLMLTPPAPAPSLEILPREVVFVIDTSGSMEGDSIVQAREALALAISRLQPYDRFNVIRFASTPSALFPDAQPASRANLTHARRWVAGLRAEGGTEMAAALAMALPPGAEDGPLRQLVFLTDGAVGNEAELFALIQQRLGRSRLFTVGIGSAPNAHFMRKAAQFGRGSFTYVGRLGEVREKMDALFARLEAPVMRDIRVDWPAGARVEAWPQPLPDLYLGEPLLLVAALDTLDGELVVHGESAGAPWQRRVALGAARPGSGIGSLWARASIEAQMDRLAAGADENEVRAAIVPLAIEHRLMSRYTSFVAVDRNPARPPEAPLAGGEMPTRLPQGWDYGAVFGELPQGASQARWLLLGGALSLLAALTLGALAWRERRLARGAASAN